MTIEKVLVISFGVLVFEIYQLVYNKIKKSQKAKKINFWLEEAEYRLSCGGSVRWVLSALASIGDIVKHPINIEEGKFDTPENRALIVSEMLYELKGVVSAYVYEDRDVAMYKRFEKIIADLVNRL